MTNAKDDGATKVPESDIAAPECMGKFKHYWQWIWVDGEMTNNCVCTTCGKYKTTGLEGVRDVL